MVSVLFSPMHMSSRPSSQLSITCQSQIRFPWDLLDLLQQRWMYEPLDDLPAPDLEAEGSSSVVAWREERERMGQLLFRRDGELGDSALASNLLPFSRVPL